MNDTTATGPRPAQSLLEDADHCVKCGICLPHCPTYVVTRHEADSPRGRIELIQAHAKGQLPASPRLMAHLDGCLACRSCEVVCPSGVPYGRLIDAARQDLQAQRRGSVYHRWARRVMLHGVIPSRRMLKGLGRVLRVYQRSGLRFLARRSGLLRLLGLERREGLLPDLAPVAGWSGYYPPHTRERGRVALFLGCIANVVDRQALSSAIAVLRHLGYAVEVPARQGCCGALHQHNADEAFARTLAERNLAAFTLDRIDAVVYTATGCGAQLMDYEALLGERAHGFATACYEITDFIHQIEWPSEVTLAPLPRRVALHTPCSLANVIRRPDPPGRVLSRIPQLELVDVTAPVRCCGAAGSYLVTQPEMADRLREYYLDRLVELAPELVVTTNVGCALHLAAGLGERGSPVEVLHPISLIERQLRG